MKQNAGGESKSRSGGFDLGPLLFEKWRLRGIRKLVREMLYERYLYLINCNAGLEHCEACWQERKSWRKRPTR